MNLPPEFQWITLSMLEGHIAMWAVRQSPYHFPDHLQEALRTFRQNAKTFFDRNGMVAADQNAVRMLINAFLLNQPIVRDWNERKNKRIGPGIVSSHDGKRDPDDDFIDLGALRMNIVRSLWQECQADNLPSPTLSPSLSAVPNTKPKRGRALQIRGARL